MWGITIVLLLAIFSLWVRWRKRKVTVLRDCGIPGPEPNLLFGNLWDVVNKNPLVCHKQWVQKYGKVVGYYSGARPAVIVTDVDILKKIQISDFQNFVNRAQLFQRRKLEKGDGFSYSLTNLRDKRWKKIRSVITPSFTTSKMKNMAPIINGAVDSLIENIDEKVEAGVAFDIYKMYQGLTMDVIGRTAFGVQTNCQKDANDPILRACKALFSGNIASSLTVIAFSLPELRFIWKYVFRIRLTLRNQGTNPISELIRRVTSVIRSRREGKANARQDLLQLMIDSRVSVSGNNDIENDDLTAGDGSEEHRSEDNNINGTTNKTTDTRPMEEYEIIDNAILFFLAGYETTSTALAFTTHFLLNYPEVQERVRDELKDLMEREGKLDYVSLQQLSYLDQVLTESLRLYPPIYLFVSREVGEDCQYGDYKFKKGLSIEVPAYIIQRDPDLWEDPDTFNPDRFSGENKAKKSSLGFQAFGAGPRNCVGMRFAQMEAKLALARILLKYRLVAVAETEKEPVKLRMNAATMAPENGIWLKAVPL